MKIMIASDLHGDLDSLKRLIEIFDNGGYGKLLFLGDLLYHGPRNDLPTGYNPKGVIALLNSYSDKIITVRGNCEAEVDGMVLDFPALADFGWLLLDGLTVYATHGHILNPENPPRLKEGDLLLYGHTHLYKIGEMPSGAVYMNPGSVSLPKGGNPKSYGELDGKTLRIFSLDGRLLEERALS